jgi:hypothetical protein
VLAEEGDVEVCLVEERNKFERELRLLTKALRFALLACFTPYMGNYRL